MEKLGVELPLLLTQIVNFTIVLILLTKFLYKPILKKLNERKALIEEGLAWTEKAKIEQEKLEKKKLELMKEAREETRVILENARKDAKQLREDILASGKKELAQLRIKQEKEMETKLSHEKNMLRDGTVDIAYEMLKKVLGEIMTSENQHKFILKQLKKIHLSHENK